MAEATVLARWQATFRGVAISPLQFYRSVEQNLILKELPNVECLYIKRREGGWLSRQRIYLQIRRERMFFDASAFVAGDSLVISYWLLRDAPGVLELFAELPRVGFVIEKTMRAATYFAVDSAVFFQRTVHDSILETIDHLTEARGLDYLRPEAREPVWEDIFD